MTVSTACTILRWSPSNIFFLQAKDGIRDSKVTGVQTCALPIPYDLAGQPDGTYTFSVRSRNFVGTLGAASVSTYVLDTTPPAAPAINGDPGALGHRRDPA